MNDERTKVTLKELMESGATVEELAMLLMGISPKEVSRKDERQKEVSRKNGKRKELLCRIYNIMKEIGIPPSIKGYSYIRTAIVLWYEDPEKYKRGITKVLYPDVAKVYQTTPSRVERAMRHAIQCAWNRGDVETLQRYFGCMICPQRGQTTNCEFIATIVEKLRFEDNLIQI